MYKVKQRSAQFDTRTLISEAFVKLIVFNDYHCITIKQLCEVAGVARKTFYNNFRVIEDVVHFQIFSTFLELENNINFDVITLDDCLYKSFEFVRSYKEIVVLYHKRGLLTIAQKYLASYISKKHYDIFIGEELPKKSYYEYLFSAVASLLISIVTTWINHDFEETEAELVSLTLGLINPQTHRKDV